MNKRIIDLVVELKKNCILKEASIMERFSISPAEYHGIISISRGDKITSGALSAKMGLSVSRGSRVIEKLIRKGYLKQTGAPEDRRCIMITLAAKGLRVKKEIDGMLDNCEKEIKSKIPVNDLNSFMNSLDKLTIILKTN
jgi:DNA-binding MarR family transcriptional regulator